jgi:hypothetical protein
VRLEFSIFILLNSKHPSVNRTTSDQQYDSNSCLKLN